MARPRIAAGARGITRAKVGMAEAMVDDGVRHGAVETIWRVTTGGKSQ